MRVYSLGERVSRRERRCQHFETPLDSGHAHWDAVRGRLDGAGSRCYQPEAQGALTVPATQQGQAPCRSDSTLPTLTSADLTLPAHSAESRRAILRNSTPTRPRVLREDGHATRTAAAETTRPRRRARGPVQVRGWIGLGGHRNSILRHRRWAGNIRWRKRCPRPCRRWTWTATRCRLYVHLSLPSSVRARAHLFCLARAGRRGAAPRVNLGPGFPPFRCRTLVPSHPRRASSRPASASPSRRFTTSTTGTSSFASSFRHLFRRGARSVTTRRSQFWPRGTDRLVAAGGVRPRVRGRRFSHGDGRFGRGCAQTVRRDWWWRRRLESHDGLPRRLHQMLAARAGPLQSRGADLILFTYSYHLAFFLSLHVSLSPPRVVSYLPLQCTFSLNRSH
jgi:hypothetical protein